MSPVAIVIKHEYNEGYHSRIESEDREVIKVLQAPELEAVREWLIPVNGDCY